MGNNVNSAGKILLIATGGTIACRETGHGLTPVLDGEGLLRELPELSGVCGVEVLDLMQRDSTDITADDRMQMARAVWENRGAYDGFVIAHGTDTLACTAALLHHLLPHIDRPVVVTGSMLTVWRVCRAARQHPARHERPQGAFDCARCVRFGQ